MIQTINQLDTKLFLWCNLHTSNKHLGAIKLVSKSGDGPLYLFISLALFLLDPIHGQLFFYTACMAYALEVPIFLMCKQMFKRQRPAVSLPYFHPHIEPADKFSLPSGHTAAAMLMATMVSHFYPTVSWIMFTWAALVGLSRILLGVHYPSDIVAGAILGSSIAWLGISTLA